MGASPKMRRSYYEAGFAVLHSTGALGSLCFRRNTVAPLCAVSSHGSLYHFGFNLRSPWILSPLNSTPRCDGARTQAAPCIKLRLINWGHVYRRAARRRNSGRPCRYRTRAEIQSEDGLVTGRQASARATRCATSESVAILCGIQLGMNDNQTQNVFKRIKITVAMQQAMPFTKTERRDQAINRLPHRMASLPQSPEILGCRNR
jgi:hypothetical protein